MNAIIPILLLLTQIVGGEFIHTVQPGETLTSIGARFGIDVRVLAEGNELKIPDRLKPGQALRIDNRHIVPPFDGAEVVVNVPQRMLFHFEEGKVSCNFPIAAGRPDWRTPLGEFEILTMEEDPAWDVPPSIQEEMRRSGKPVVTRIPPSPENPLGKYWIGLSLPGIGIHGTNAPSSIYKLATHGCIRLHPEDVQNLFPRVDIGTRGRVIYQPVLIANTGDSIFLEVHPDAYRHLADPLRHILDVAKAGGFLDMLDLPLVKEVVEKRDGLARDVTRR